MTNLLNFHPLQMQKLARNWLLEDTSSLNFEVFVDEEQERQLDILMKSEGVLAGIPFVNAVFSEVGATVHWHNYDGDKIKSARKIASVFGSTKKILLAESVVLNVLSRASGIATITSELCESIKHEKWKGTFDGTGKTTPGFGKVEEYGLLMGGVMPRYDLANPVILKYNFLSDVESIEEAVKQVRKLYGYSRTIKVECRTYEEAEKAAKSGCNIVMCDDIESQEIMKKASDLKRDYPNMMIEVSARITKDNVKKYLYPSTDIISSTYLFQSYPILDFSMEFRSTTNYRRNKRLLKLLLK